MVSPQQQVGQNIQRGIRKALKPRAADVGIAIVEGISKGLNNRIKNNLDYINVNLKDEEERFTQLFNDYDREKKNVDALITKGKGDLTEGIFLSNLESVKNAAGITGLEAIKEGVDQDSDLFLALRKEAEEQANILNKRLEGYSKLVTNYEPETEDQAEVLEIFADDVKSKGLFQQPIVDSVTNLALSQKNFGINNPLDELGSILKLNERGKFNLLESFNKKELELQKIVEQTSKYRVALPTYAGSSKILSEFIQDKEEGEGGKNANKKLKKQEEKFNAIVATSRQWSNSKGLDEKGKYDYAFYFMPLLDDDARIIQAEQNKTASPDELADFIAYYNAQPTNSNRKLENADEIVSIFYNSNQFAESFTDNDLTIRFSQAFPTTYITKTTGERISYNDASDIIELYGGDFNAIPNHLKAQVIYGLGESAVPSSFLASYKNFAVKKEDLTSFSGRVKAEINSSANTEQKQLYNQLDGDDRLTFQITVISQVKRLIASGGLDEQKAIRAAVNMQLLGVQQGSDWELFNAFFEPRPKFNKYEELYQPQQFATYTPKDSGDEFIADIFKLTGQRVLDENQIKSYNQELNTNPILWYAPESLGTTQPQLFKDGQQFSLNKGNSVWKFVSDPEDGIHWVLQ